MNMSTLAIQTLLLAGITMPFYAMFFISPSVTREGLRRFPRNRWSGWLLAIAAVAWAAWLLHGLPLGRFESLKTWLVPAAVVFAGLVCYYMEELLAPRAFGALLLLYPAPLLDAARLHDSGWSVVMSVVAYAMAIKGMALLLSPYLFRHVSERILNTDRTCRLAGAGGLVFDALLLLLATTVY